MPLDTRKSGLIQSSPPGLSRTELFHSTAGKEVFQAIRSRDHSHVDNNAISGGGVHQETNLTLVTPVITGQPRNPVTSPGNDVIVNGAFAADTDWTKGTGWTIAAGLATASGAQVADSDLTQVGATLLQALVENQTYEVTFTVSGYVAGNVTAVVGDTEGTDRAADGTFVENIIAGSGADIDIRGDLAFDGDVTGVIVRRASGSVRLGGTLHLSCGSVGNLAPTYQWDLDDSAIVGATDAVLEVANVTQADAGTYHCECTNATGTVDSADIVVTVV